MSIKKLILTALAGTIVGVNVWILNSRTDRKPSSVVSIPPLPVKPWSHSPFGKMNQSMTVTITAPQGIPSSDDQEILLRAEVTLHRDVPGNVEYRWELPDGAEVISGHLVDVWPNLQAGQTAVTEISLLKVSSAQLKTVSILVSADDTSARYAASGSFATRTREGDNISSGLMKVDNASGLQKTQDAGKLLKLHQ